MFEHDDDNDDSSSPNVPAWMKAVYVFGVPAAIAMFLVWIVAGTQSSKLDAIGQSQAAMVGKIDAHVVAAQVSADAARMAAEEVRSNGLRLERYLQLMCINTARTVAERNSCLNVR